MNFAHKILLALSLAGIIMIYSCEDTIPIVDSGRFTDEFVWQTPNMARGVLFWAYVGLPNYYYNFGIGSEFLEIATDDATTSNSSSVAIQFATGALSPGNNSLDSWSSSYNKIRQINLFLQKGITDQLYNQDTILNRRFYNRFRAEAYVMRAWWYFDLLKNYGGIENGQPMGIPIITKEITDQEALQLKRATYMECVNQIVADCETALKISDFPEDYVGTDLVTGTNWYGAANKRIARVIKTMAYLYAASPAFNRDSNIALWDSAASNAIAAIKAIDGVPNANALPARDFYTVTNNQDVIWPRPQNSATSFVYEQQNLPPSLRGNGFTNPSQELVNAFYDAEGYPITHSSSKYNPQDPYNGRDSRLKKFILCNGMVYSGHTVETYEGGDDAPGSSLNASKTGYYLLKFLSPNAELYPEAKNGRASFVALFSKTELYLIFAEAMNELAGPDDKRYGLSSREALSKIRKRAGFVADPYMTGIVSKTEFRALVRNERRVELCFEGKRFWDLRRWNEPVNTNVSRARIRSENGNFVYESPEVIEKKLFNSPFMPLPLNETIIIQGLKQNDGWSN